MTQEEMLENLLDITKELERLKALYVEYDELVLSLRRSCFVSAEQEGPSFVLQDNFLDKDGEERNTAHRVGFVKRFEIKIKELKGE